MSDVNLEELRRRGWEPEDFDDADSYSSFDDDDFDDNILSDFENDYANGKWQGLSKREKLNWLDKHDYYPAQFLLNLTEDDTPVETIVTEEIIGPEVNVDSTGTSSDTDEENDDTDKNIISALIDKKY